MLAEEILEAALKDGNSSPYELANLAAVKTFLGKEDESRRLIDAANYWSTRKDEIGIVKFNLFIISAYHSNYDQSLVYLNGSIDKHNETRLSPSHTLRPI